jgi:RimJ/RimL family protein N-acetyltransferase
VSELGIVAVDPFDDDAFDAFHAAYLAAELAAEDGVTSPWQLEELRAMAQQPGTSRWVGAYAGRVGGRVVTTGWITTPLLDNTDRAELSVETVPGARRRGYGAAMLEHLERTAAERGRTILAATTAWPHRAGADGDGEAGPQFARSVGFRLALGDVKRVLRLPVPCGVLDRLAGEAAPHHEGYELRSWSGPVPDELLEGWARLTGSLVTEAPTGDLDLEPEHRDPAVVREDEAVLARQGRRKYNTVALDADGELVAFTEIVTTEHEPGRSYQWGTLVRRDTRGHRLGLAVKVANLRLLQEERPDIVRLTTYNAEVNAPMIAVNERLGFTPVARLGEFQKRL